MQQRIPKELESEGYSGDRQDAQCKVNAPQPA
jgi:hypothetical protein